MFGLLRRAQKRAARVQKPSATADEVRAAFDDWRHLTWSGRRDAVWFWVRKWFVAPAPAGQRCAMGSPIGPHVHCPRRAPRTSLWCAKCTREIVRQERRRKS